MESYLCVRERAGNETGPRQKNQMTKELTTIFDGPIECRVDASDGEGALVLATSDDACILISSSLLAGVRLSPGDVITARFMRGSVHPEGKQ